LHLVNGSLGRPVEDLPRLPAVRGCTPPPVQRQRRLERPEQEELVARYQAGDLMFCTEIGTPLDPRNLNRSFRSLLIRAEVGVVLVEKDGEKRWVTRVRLHDLRHSCGSFLLAQGASPRVVMEILGHSGIAVTMNTYAHVLPTLLGDAITGMDRMLGEPAEDDDDN
jgi:integrase